MVSSAGCLDTVEPAVHVDSPYQRVRWWWEHKATFTTSRWAALCHYSNIYISTSSRCYQCGHRGYEMVQGSHLGISSLYISSQCFTCATCRNRLVPGDRFHYINGTIFCEHDRPGAGLLSGHPASLQTSSMMSDQKVSQIIADFRLNYSRSVIPSENIDPYHHLLEMPLIWHYVKCADFITTHRHTQWRQ